MLFYLGCVNMQKYDHIMDRSSNKAGLLHDIFQIGIKFVVFDSNHDSKIIYPSFQYKTDNLQNTFLNNLL